MNLNLNLLMSMSHTKEKRPYSGWSQWSLQKTTVLKKNEIAKAKRIVIEYQQDFLEKYNEKHGKTGRKS